MRVVGDRSSVIFVKVGLGGTMESVDFEVRHVGFGRTVCYLAGPCWADVSRRCQLQDGDSVVFVATGAPNVYQMALNRHADE